MSWQCEFGSHTLNKLEIFFYEMLFETQLSWTPTVPFGRSKQEIYMNWREMYEQICIRWRSFQFVYSFIPYTVCNIEHKKNCNVYFFLPFFYYFQFKFKHQIVFLINWIHAWLNVHRLLVLIFLILLTMYLICIYVLVLLN